MSAVDDIRAIRHTAADVRAAGLDEPVLPPPVEDAPRGKQRKLRKAHPVVSTWVGEELRLRAAVAADVDGTTISELMRDALRDRVEQPVSDLTEAAVWRLARNAASDDGYRMVLVDLAAEHGGIYREAVSRIYTVEKETLGRWEALVRRALDLSRLEDETGAEADD